MKSLQSELQILVVFVGIMLASFSSNAYGISYILHADSLLELQIAKDGPTRINIEGEKINDIFIHPGEAAEVAVHDSGYLFILPQQNSSKLYLTLIGENGTIQDLMLNFTKSKPAPIRLIKFDLEQEVTKLTNNKEEKYHECNKQRCKRRRK
ncbi:MULTISPECIES: hypothetical protein [spotted fever group]|uniref:Uncharacterized protein n=1 Tax=Rickettsia tamurae subsp. buchneri TaxID=1462938 RepID=A0A8E0WM85_9RICK|nr:MULTISPECIES: hypothetical protein [spotted fever group]EER21668.1 hypothetical protein REIS_0836 [Rickettsia endosymbiont of Ixodes scapularis]KDO03221.1 hypothetical protein REISMN_02750 [Rickettsia tamurae subsp. buchneri]